ncbi:MAG: dynamin, partial [Gemmatimonadales bacterium]
IGDVGPSFGYNRQALLDSIGRVSREVVGSYNREAESRTLAKVIQGAFATTALAEAGALGLGTLVVTVVTGAAADVTGILLAAALAVGGFYVLPRKRRQSQRDFQRRVSELRSGLKDALTRQVHLELEQSSARINEAIGPYRRFVQSQQQRLNEARAELVATEDALLRLRAEVEKR